MYYPMTSKYLTGQPSQIYKSRSVFSFIQAFHVSSCYQCVSLLCFFCCCCLNKKRKIIQTSISAKHDNTSSKSYLERGKYCYVCLLGCSLSAYTCMSSLLTRTGLPFAGCKGYSTNLQDYFSFLFVPCTITNISVLKKVICFLPLCN